MTPWDALVWALAAGVAIVVVGVAVALAVGIVRGAVKR